MVKRSDSGSCLRRALFVAAALEEAPAVQKDLI